MPTMEAEKSEEKRKREATKSGKERQDEEKNRGVFL
jgi:hypothetical protein